jgi:outer membrane protein OmpA-like peptidoglycan-associated protein
MHRKITVTPLVLLQFLFTSFLIHGQGLDSIKNEPALPIMEVEKNQQPNRTALQALDQASLGGSAGALVGRQMDQLADELRKIVKGASLERISEGILLTFQSPSLFEEDSYEPLSATKTRFRNLASMLNKFGHPYMLIEVHTDNTGEETYNQSLSDKRAKSLEALLTKEGANKNRLLARGYGDKHMTLTTPSEGGPVNRRVELIILANDEMKALAKKGEVDEFFATRK